MAIREDLELDLSGALGSVGELDSALSTAAQSFETSLAGALEVLGTAQPIPLEADASAIPPEIDAAIDAAGAADVPVTANTEGMTAEIAAVTTGQSAEITVTADTAAAESSIAQLDATVTDASADFSGLGGSIEGTSESLDSVGESGGGAGLGLNTAATAANTLAASTTTAKAGASTATGALSALGGVAGQLSPQLGAAAGGMSQLGDSAIKAPGPIQATVGAIGAGVGVGLGLTSVFTGLATQVRSFSTVTGASAEESSRWVGAASVMGIESAKLNTGFAVASRNISTHEAELTRDGVAIARNADGSVNLIGTVLNAGEAYRSTTNQLEKNRIAQDLFGRQWRELAPILNRTGAEIDALGRKSGMMMSQADLNRASAFKIELNALKTQVSVLAGSLGSELLPAVQGNITTLSALVTGLQKVHAVEFGAKVVGWVNPLNKLGDVIGLVTGKIDPMTGKVKDNSAAQQAAAQQAAATAAAQQGTATANDLVAASGGNAERALNAFNLSEDALEANAGEVTQALQAQVTAQNALLTAATQYADLQLGLQGSIIGVKEAQNTLAEANAKVAYTGGSVVAITLEQEKAELGLARQVSAVAHAAAEQEINTRKLRGETVTTADATRLYNDSLGFVIGTLDGPSREAVLRHITLLKDIPGQKVTPLLVDPAPAQAGITVAEQMVDGWRVRTSNTKPPLNVDPAPVQAGITMAQKAMDGWHFNASRLKPSIDVDPAPAQAGIAGIKSAWSGVFGRGAGEGAPSLNVNNTPAIGSIDAVDLKYKTWRDYVEGKATAFMVNPEPAKASLQQVDDKRSNTEKAIDTANPALSVIIDGASAAIGWVTGQVDRWSAHTSNTKPPLNVNPAPVQAGITVAQTAMQGWHFNASLIKAPLNADPVPAQTAITGVDTAWSFFRAGASSQSAPLNADPTPAIGSIDAADLRFNDWRSHVDLAWPGIKANPEPATTALQEVDDKRSNTEKAIDTANPGFRVMVDGAITALQWVIDKAGEAARAVAGAGGSWNPLNRMAGGSVEANQAYIVGERHAELFVPDTSGTIVPRVPPMARGEATGGGGSTTVAFNIDARGSTMTEAQFRRVAREEIAPAVEQVVAKVRSK